MYDQTICISSLKQVEIWMTQPVFHEMFTRLVSICHRFLWPTQPPLELELARDFPYGKGSSSRVNQCDIGTHVGKLRRFDLTRVTFPVGASLICPKEAFSSPVPIEVLAVCRDYRTSECHLRTHYRQGK